ncbi:hypothetical protein AAHC03_0895 [Spirometra sp. Aus1]
MSSLGMKEQKKGKDREQETVDTSTVNDAITIDCGDNSPKLRYFQLFRYAKKWELACVVIGLLASAANGFLMPLSMVYFADIVDDLISPKPNILNSILPQVKIYSIIGGTSLILGFLQAYLLLLVAERQSKRLRLLYFKGVLRQDVEWHEKNVVGSVITRLNDSIDQIEEGIGANLTNFLRDMSQFLTGLIIAFTKGWKLTLVAVALMPIISLVFTALALSIRSFVGIEQKAYSRAYSVAAEVLSAVRTVLAFGGEAEATKRYGSELSTAQRAGVKRSMAVGASVGMISFSIFSVVAVLYYYGLVLITKEEYTPGKVVLVIMNIVYGSIALGRSLPLMEFFLRAAGVAQPVFATIERVPVINSEGGGRQLDALRGQIEFRDVSFSYPQRPNIPVLRHFNLKIAPGETVAVVGPSGSGKSTIMQLIQRHYDADQGQVLIDGVDIRDLDVKWLREQLGVVSQEPVLFAGSVKTNISMMKPGASQDEIEYSAKIANAHDFIKELPEGYETWVGEGGTGISGGQKQRIAIARALLRNPTILLLDEATSALDTRSEHAVQTALDNASSGRSVVMVAHRLTTVRNAGRIIVVDEGVVKETGTHEDLLALGGIYAGMWTSMKEEASEDKNPEDASVEAELERLKGCFSIKRSGKTESNRKRKVKELPEEPAEPADDDNLDANRNKSSSITWRTLKLSKPYAHLLAVGYVMAVGSGILEPSFALVYAETFDLYFEPVVFKRIPTRAKLLAGMMSLVGFLRFLTVFCQYTALGVSGEKLTKHMRKELFGTMLKQEAGWFDRPENQSGNLTSRLATEVPCLRKVSGERGGVIVEGLVLVIVSLILAFYFSWQLALVNLAFIPPLALFGAMQAQDMVSSVGTNSVAGSEIVQESISAYRTVTSLAVQMHFYSEFRKKFLGARREKKKSRIIYSVVNAVAQGVQFFQSAAVYYVGAKLIDDGTLTSPALFRVLVLTFGAQGLGRAVSFLPSLNDAVNGARKIFVTLDRRSRLPADKGEEPSVAVRGEVEFRDVHFRYPTRPGVEVLKGFQCTINSKTNTAFVGQSGCGKSTCLQLIQRLYDADICDGSSGVFLDGTDLRHLKPSWIRRQIGIVSQEPNLFDMSIRDNIGYGALDRETTMEEIIEAARQANIHDFIESLPEGYDTSVGFRGSELSGGQKQRIAIARVLLRKPAILLFDEATSALDRESERVVQATLDKTMAAAERTCLMVAHRLTTVEKCHQIVVLQNGIKVESGSPEALMRAEGVYFALHNANAIMNSKGPL